MAVAAETPDVKAARAQLWSVGVLQWKLDEAQKVLYAAINKARDEGKHRYVLLCSRRWGKTYMMVVMALEQALRNPNFQIAFISKTKRSARDIAEKLVRKLITDCPLRYKPGYHKQDFRWEFRNGSTLYFMGTDSGHYEKARGREFNLIIVDEAGFIDNLDDIVKEVFAPTLLTTRGFMLFASTPPKTATHPFIGIYRRAISDGTYTLKTIFDNPRLTKEDFERAREESGGEGTPFWRREYLCEMTTEESNLVIPEWTEARAAELVQDVPRPQFCDKYISLDLGFRDKTVALFSWWDFANARLVVEDEIALSGAETTTAALALAIASKMQALWGQPEDVTREGEIYQFSDVDPRLIHELRTLHGLKFQQTMRDNKDAAINQARLMVQAGQIVINPRCKLLIQTLFTATWNKTHKEYERKELIGHADALDALLYTVRNLRRNRNPVPANVHWTEEHQMPRPKPLSGAAKTLGACYGNKTATLQSQVMAKLGRRRF